MHIPTDSIVTSTFRKLVALVGAPGSGKTTAAATFPNPIFYDFDNKLPLGVTSIPLWNPEFCDKLAKRNSPQSPPNQRDAFRKHLRDNCLKYTKDQTLILDSWTFLQNASDRQIHLEENDDDKPNQYGFWKKKQLYALETLNRFKECACQVVVTFHETIERDVEGEATGKLRPLMEGGFKDQLLGHFTDVWRQLCDPVERGEDGRIKLVDGKTSFKRGYYWRLLSDPQVNTNTNPVLGEKIRKLKISMIPANYNEILKIYETV
jgi:hypothetical protein